MAALSVFCASGPQRVAAIRAYWTVKLADATLTARLRIVW